LEWLVLGVPPIATIFISLFSFHITMCFGLTGHPQVKYIQSFLKSRLSEEPSFATTLEGVSALAGHLQAEYTSISGKLPH
jgi:hypothetical protein